MAKVDTWPHTPSARATIYSGEDPANPDGWTDNLLIIKNALNAKPEYAFGVINVVDSAGSAKANSPITSGSLSDTTNLIGGAWTLKEGTGISMTVDSVNRTITMESTVSAAYPWLIDLDVIMTPVSSTNWSTITADAGYFYGGWRQSTGAVNAEIGFDVMLGAGTWTCELMHRRNTSAGIYTVLLDGVSVGTIDGYGSLTGNVLGSITGITVASSGKQRLTVRMATKNASSGGYTGYIQHIQLRRTA